MRWKWKKFRGNNENFLMSLSLCEKMEGEWEMKSTRVWNKKKAAKNKEKFSHKNYSRSLTSNFWFSTPASWTGKSERSGSGVDGNQITEVYRISVITSWEKHVIEVNLINYALVSLIKHKIATAIDWLDCRDELNSHETTVECLACQLILYSM